MTKKHNPAFEKLCEEVRKNIPEISVPEVQSTLSQRPEFILIDVREDHEWKVDHIPGAVHLGRGIIERDIESKYPDFNTKIVLYCGGGYRSALAAGNLIRMGYPNVQSMAGGIRAWRDNNFQIAKESK